MQPSSTVFMYLLGIIAMGVGFFFFRIQAQSQARRWWGLALLLWGLGALLAGTSYQAFSYEIKCAGQTLCSWTSWWEIAYLLLSAASVDALLVAGAYASCLGKGRQALIKYACLNLALYVVIVFVGAFLLNAFMISFELLLIFTAPSILVLLILHGWRYYQFRANMDLALVITWLWLGMVIAAYFLYWALDITLALWARGIWFSENDVLHLGLISWMVYIAVSVSKQIWDAPRSVVEADR
ncbi:MAG: hypothetical protein JW862_01055 [Anaerolineales bacterium]|nr:hypothetical protein [Anaerolineales bacterium]